MRAPADMLFGAFAPIAVFMPTVTTMAANGEGGLLPLGVFTGSTMLAMSFCEPINSHDALMMVNVFSRVQTAVLRQTVACLGQCRRRSPGSSASSLPAASTVRSAMLLLVDQMRVTMCMSDESSFADKPLL